VRYFLALVVAIAAITAFAQPPAAFEAASIHKSPPLPPRVSFRVQPETLQAENLTLPELTQRAFALLDYQLVAPDSMKDARFSITARSASPVSRQQMMTMLQTLLADRFHLTYHWADKTMSVYVLGPEGDHHGLKPSTLAEDDSSVGIALGAQEPLKRVLRYTRVNMQTLGDSLSGGLANAGLPVIDRTGLTGFYDFILKFNLTGPPPSKIEDGDVPVSVSSQLGISVKETKAPIRVLIVDHADAEPTEN
jgi:uncharacterized protein (TIGR03435 family)